MNRSRAQLRVQPEYGDLAAAVESSTLQLDQGHGPQLASRAKKSEIPTVPSPSKSDGPVEYAVATLAQAGCTGFIPCISEWVEPVPGP